MTTNAFEIKQLSKCFQTLSKSAKPIAPVVLEYDRFSTSGFTESTDWGKALTNTDEVNCPVKKCKIQKRVGGQCVQYPPDGKLKMRSSAPWLITY